MSDNVTDGFVGIVIQQLSNRRWIGLICRLAVEAGASASTPRRDIDR